MLSAEMKVNKKLLPIKGHFFLFNAGTAPLVPYLSTYARQLGFTSATVGLIYTILPIFGLIAKPLFGVIADRFKLQKSIFILFQIVTIVSFSAIYFIPGNSRNSKIILDCNDGVSVLKSCVNISDVDNCKVDSLSNLNGTASCEMNCDMTSPEMWQTVCEHWGIPEYCYSNKNILKYSTRISRMDVKLDNCYYFTVNNVTLDGYQFTPRCSINEGYANNDEPCNFNCTGPRLASLLSQGADMTCVDNMLNYRMCSNVTTSTISIEFKNSECMASCDIQEAWRLQEICEGWQADVAESCQPSVSLRDHLPNNLSFTGTVLLHTTISEHNCVFVQLQHITLPDNSVHYPNCLSQVPYKRHQELFHSSCEINCDNIMLNEIFEAGSGRNSETTTEYTTEFWLFFLMMVISWIGQAVVVTFADAICFNLLGTEVSEYGKQRLWGSVGWGIFSLTTGVLIDAMSDGAYKDYKIAFILMFVFMTGDVIASCFLKTNTTKMSMNIISDVGSLLSSLPTFIFMVWTIAVGLCTGLLWQFLFWHLEDVAGESCDGDHYTKTLQGLVSAIQTFGGEIPFLFVSGYILKKIGHTNMMSLVLFAFGVRFILYSFLTNAWWVLPIEMLQGITFGMFYPTMTSYATVVSPSGAETTVQGLVGAIFEGVGTSLGSFIGGRIYDVYGGWITFRCFGIGVLICCVIHVLVQWLLKNKILHTEFVPGYESVMKYENDKVRITDETDLQ